MQRMDKPIGLRSGCEFVPSPTHVVRDRRHYIVLVTTFIVAPPPFRLRTFGKHMEVRQLHMCVEF